MKKICILIIMTVVFYFTGFSQKMSLSSDIPENLVGTWVLDLPGEGEIPSQILKYTFRYDDTEGSVCEFDWLFKRTTDENYITVAAILGHLLVGDDFFQTTMYKIGSQQIQPMVIEFSDTIQWHYPGDDLFERTHPEEIHPFEINGETLIIKNDENGDGDYEDEGEIQEYVKNDG